jgi:hypothetical protein
MEVSSTVLPPMEEVCRTQPILPEAELAGEEMDLMGVEVVAPMRVVHGLVAYQEGMETQVDMVEAVVGVLMPTEEVEAVTAVERGTMMMLSVPAAAPPTGPRIFW